MRLLITLLMLLPSLSGAQGVARRLAEINGLATRDGLKAWWRPALTGSAIDWFDGRNGTLNGNATATRGVGFCFDGNDDYVSYSPFSPTNTFSVAAWVRLTGNADTQKSIIFENENPGADANSHWSMYLQNNPTTKTNRLVTKLGLVGIGESGAANDIPLQNAFSNQWRHVGIKKDGTNLVFYFDGVNLGTSYTLGSTLLTGGTIGAHIGGRPSWFTPPTVHEFQGSIDSIVFYYRVLSDAEYRQLYEYGRHTHAN